MEPDKTQIDETQSWRQTEEIDKDEKRQNSNEVPEKIRHGDHRDVLARQKDRQKDRLTEKQRDPNQEE